ncbi:MAG: DNA adenine methylase, partial [Labrys sp. (in: a-proteobacteria)]
AYIGGKRQLAGRIVERIDAIAHETYVEPFVGMGGVFLRRTRAPKSEVINDISREVATFFRVLQRHYEALMDHLKWKVTSRAEFERLMAQPADTLTDIERAARFLYLQRLAFGGKVAGRSFGVSLATPGRFDVTKLGVILDDLHQRLSGVIIECLRWEDVIVRYDAPGTLFYLDPPYFGSEGDYGAGVFARSEFLSLAEALRGIAGGFLLSINDRPEIREVFAGFDMEEVGLTYTINGAAQQAARELIISNGPAAWHPPARDLFV